MARAEFFQWDQTVSLASTVYKCSFKHCAFLCASRSQRFGEAAHPGPVFTIGTFNPTGLGAKHGIVAQLEPGFTQSPRRI